jgi:hypothetical protein
MSLCPTRSQPGSFSIIQEQPVNDQKSDGKCMVRRLVGQFGADVCLNGSERAGCGEIGRFGGGVVVRVAQSLFALVQCGTNGFLTKLALLIGSDRMPNGILVPCYTFCLPNPRRYEMPGYWWQCHDCGNKATFLVASSTRSLPAFLRDKMVHSGWDQALLVAPCKCGKEMRVTYDFPGRRRELLQVIRMVGIEWGQDYLMMMWETAPASDPRECWFDFKYLRGRNPWGLNKAAVFPQASLTRIFALYRQKAGVADFP